MATILPARNNLVCDTMLRVSGIECSNHRKRRNIQYHPRHKIRTGQSLRNFLLAVFLCLPLELAKKNEELPA